jgi:hypothetical protein
MQPRHTHRTAASRHRLMCAAAPPACGHATALTGAPPCWHTECHACLDCEQVFVSSYTANMGASIFRVDPSREKTDEFSTREPLCASQHLHSPPASARSPPAPARSLLAPALACVSPATVAPRLHHLLPYSPLPSSRLSHSHLFLLLGSRVHHHLGRPDSVRLFDGRSRAASAAPLQASGRVGAARATYVSRAHTVNALSLHLSIRRTLLAMCCIRRTLLAMCCIRRTLLRCVAFDALFSRCGVCTACGTQACTRAPRTRIVSWISSRAPTGTWPPVSHHMHALPMPHHAHAHARTPNATPCTHPQSIR